MTRKHLILLGHVAVVALLLGLAWSTLRGPAMARPFAVDEFLTLQYYTWVGVQPSGELNDLNHITDYYSLNRPDPRQLGMATYCSMGRWPEPNNHVLNSLLMNVSTALGPRDERWARVPALFGGLAFAVGMYFLCSSVLGWRVAAPLAAVWAWFIPYVVVYSQTARGYTWMLALQVILLILAYLMARTARSITLGALAVAVAALSLMNVVSTAVDWLVPFYASLLLFRPARPDAEGPPAKADREWRRYVLVQALSVGGLCAVFFVSHLASLYSSAQQYGLPFHSAGQCLDTAWQVLDELLPDFGSKALAAAGVVGLVVLGVSRQHRFLAALALLLVAVNLLHFVLTRRFPYGRAAGYFLPVVLLGAAYLVERVLGVFESDVTKAFLLAALVVPTLGIVVPSWGRTLEDETLTALLAKAQRIEPTTGARPYMLVQTGADYILSFYLPSESKQVKTVAPGMKLNILVTRQDTPRTSSEPGFLRAGAIRLTSLSGETRPLEDKGPLPADAWILWYPDFTLLGINAADQDAFVRDSGCQAVFVGARFQVKFDVVSQRQCYMFLPAERSGSCVPAEVVREGLRRFGGRAVVFVPTNSRVY